MCISIITISIMIIIIISSSSSSTSSSMNDNKVIIVITIMIINRISTDALQDLVDADPVAQRELLPHAPRQLLVGELLMMIITIIIV